MGGLGAIPALLRCRRDGVAPTDEGQPHIAALDPLPKSWLLPVVLQQSGLHNTRQLSALLFPHFSNLPVCLENLWSELLNSIDRHLPGFVSAFSVAKRPYNVDSLLRTSDSVGDGFHEECAIIKPHNTGHKPPWNALIVIDSANDHICAYRNFL